jgi:hypothetical protein
LVFYNPGHWKKPLAYGGVHCTHLSKVVERPIGLNRTRTQELHHEVHGLL